MNKKPPQNQSPLKLTKIPFKKEQLEQFQKVTTLEEILKENRFLKEKLEKQKKVIFLFQKLKNQNDYSCEEFKSMNDLYEELKLSNSSDSPLQEEEYQYQAGINVDQMTYEQLLELEDNIGVVSKGLKDEEINQIPEFEYGIKLKLNSNLCTICQSQWENKEILKQLPCQHNFHNTCINEWLQKSKACPICKQEVI